jgi:hypothetical protein
MTRTDPELFVLYNFINPLYCELASLSPMRKTIFN